MSGYGWLQAELARQRKEELRRRHLMEQAQALLQACNETMAEVQDPAVQQFAASNLRIVRQELDTFQRMSSSDPKSALLGIRKTQPKLHRIIAQAEAAAKKWSKDREEANARLAHVKAQLDASRDTLLSISKNPLPKEDSHLETARSLIQVGDYRSAFDVLRKVEEKIHDGIEVSFDETVRREVVRGLLSTLKDMGFVVEGPRIVKNANEGGIVTLLGRMPSGRLARFEIKVDGRLDFDLDGYEDRLCAKDLDEIESRLKERFAVKLGPPQITWKNPDRLSRSARDLPSGGESRSGQR